MKLSKSWDQCSEISVKYEQSVKVAEAISGWMMKTTADYLIECKRAPISSSRSQAWENIVVEQFQHPAGEGKMYYGNEHSICLSLTSRPVPLFQTQGDKAHTAAYAKGDFCITPARTPFFCRWESDDHFVQIRLSSNFVHGIANETMKSKADRLELMPEFKRRDAQVEAIAQMFLAELQQENASSKLYVESLATVLAVHLIRQYATTQPQIPVYEGGLPQRQLLQVLDYINDHLKQDIKLTDLAALLNISQFHFSHLFKQSTGVTPYQYLLQQRIERAKQLLKESDRPITDIAFLCGFNSHSHLSKQFRQITGITPRAYRAN